MSYKITISNPGNHFCNPLLTLADQTFATREEACEALYNAMYNTIDSEAGCEMVTITDYTKPGRGMLFACDEHGDNCEPVNTNDDPYTIDEADNCEVGDGDGSVALRRATLDDDCDGTVSHVAVDRDGEIVGYYRFRELIDYGYPLDDYATDCHEYIMREGHAREDGVSACVEEVES